MGPLEALPPGVPKRQLASIYRNIDDGICAASCGLMPNNQAK